MMSVQTDKLKQASSDHIKQLGVTANASMLKQNELDVMAVGFLHNISLHPKA